MTETAGVQHGTAVSSAATSFIPANPKVERMARRLCWIPLVALAWCGGCGDDTNAVVLTDAEIASVKAALAKLAPAIAVPLDSALVHAGAAANITLIRAGNDTLHANDIEAGPVAVPMRAIGVQLDLDVTAPGGSLTGLYSGLLAWEAHGSAVKSFVFLLGSGDTLGTYLVTTAANYSGFIEPLESSSVGAYLGTFGGLSLAAQQFEAETTISATDLVRARRRGSMGWTGTFRIMSIGGRVNWLKVDFPGGIPAVSLVMRGSL